MAQLSLSEGTQGQYTRDNLRFTQWYQSRHDLTDLLLCTQNEAQQIFMRYALYEFSTNDASGGNVGKIISAVNSHLGNYGGGHMINKMPGLRHMKKYMNRMNLKSRKGRAFSDEILDYILCKFMKGKDRKTRVIRAAILFSKRNLVRISNIAYSYRDRNKMAKLRNIELIPSFHKCTQIVVNPPMSKSQGHSDDEPRIINCVCNESKIRPCLMHELLDIIHDDWILNNSNAPLFRMSNGKPLNRYSYEKRFKQLVTDAGLLLNAYTSHAGRRGGATDAYREGKSKEEIAKLGGWKGIASIDRYIIKDNPDLPMFSYLWVNTSFPSRSVRPFLFGEALSPLPKNWTRMSKRPSHLSEKLVQSRQKAIDIYADSEFSGKKSASKLHLSNKMKSKTKKRFKSKTKSSSSSVISFLAGSFVMPS